MRIVVVLLLVLQTLVMPGIAQGNGSVHGRIVDAENGKGLPDVQVHIGTIGFGSPMPFTPSTRPPTTTDQDGYFTITDVAAGDAYSVLAIKAFRERRLNGNVYCRPVNPANSTAGCTTTGAGIFSVATGVVTTLDTIELPPAARLQGIVRDAATLAPVEGVSVASANRFSTRTGSDGRYVIDYIRLQSYRPAASRHGYLTTSIAGIPCGWYNGCGPADMPEFVVSEPVEYNLDWNLSAAASLEVRAVSMGMIIPVEADFFFVDGAAWHANSMISEVPPGSYGAVFTNLGEFASEVYDNIPCSGSSCYEIEGTEINLVAGEHRIIDVDLEPLTSLSGVVRDMDGGAPIEGVKVSLIQWEKINGEPAPLTLEEVTTGSDGEFVFPGIPSGYTYDLRTENTNQYVDVRYPDTSCTPWRGCPPGNGSAVDPAGYLAVNVGDHLTNIDFNLAKGGAIAGHTGIGSSPVNAEVLIDALDGEWGIYLNSSNGIYASRTGLPPGNYAVRASYRWASQLFDGIDCPDGIDSCDLALATEIPVVGQAQVSGIDFNFHPEVDRVFHSGFENPPEAITPAQDD